MNNIRLLVFVGVAFAIIVIGVLLFSHPTKSPSNPTTTPAPTNNSNGNGTTNAEEGIQFLGVDSLLNHGLTSDQAAGFQKAMNQFIAKGHDTKTVKILSDTVVATIHSSDSNDHDRMTFQFQLDDGTYNAQLEYFDLTSIELFIYNSAGNSLLFDSGKIDSSS